MCGGRGRAASRKCSRFERRYLFEAHGVNGTHVLDRPVWQALADRQFGFAVGGAAALRFAPQFGVFGAAADASPAALDALSALVPADGPLVMVEDERFPVPAGCVAHIRAECDQMVWRPGAGIAAAAGSIDGLLPLGDADAAEMLALAQLTKPGPFFAQTHQLGSFVGIRHAGRLVAMAGERMRPPGFTEVSGVCTHPDHRGHGYARVLMQAVMAGIVQRGETPILHVYTVNTGAIALYETLGFALRRRLIMSTLLKGSELP
jgi:ribosomal protein S18 acetylase RimI-like enzyme